MSKKTLLTIGLSLVLLVGLVALSWAAVQPRLPVAEPGAQRPAKYYPNKAEAFEITHWDFESANGQWTPGMPGELWHTTTKRCCDACSTWWNGIDQFNGYASDWRNYLDTDAHEVADSITLQWNHMWSIERGILVQAPYDAWDIAGLQISVDGGSFYPLDPLFTGWFGYGYTRTRSFAYGFEWNIGDYYGGWEDKNPGWPATCDMSGITLKPGDQPFESHYSTYTIQAGDQIVFRFEFCSDPAYSSAEGDAVEGWYVDDIVLTSGANTYENHGTNVGASLQMHPGYHVFPADWVWVTDNSAPHEYKSATHSWWVPDTTNNHNSYLVSPWIQLPDTAKLAWISYYQDQFSPGSAIEGYLSDYFYWYVRSEGDIRWTELTHDYDRLGDSTHCDWDVNWRLWENDSLYNGTFFAVPDRRDYGSKVQFAIKFMTDTTVQDQGKQDCGGFVMKDARGLYIDDFTVWGQKCYDQNMAMHWETEDSRPFPMSVPAGSSWTVNVLARNEYGCVATALDAPVSVEVLNAENWWKVSTTVPAGFPGDADSIIEMGTFTASQASDTAQTADIEILLPGDNNPSDNVYTNVGEFNFFVTDSLREYMGYDDLRMKTGQRSWIPWKGIGVYFRPKFNWGYWMGGGEGYKLLSVRWLSAYAGSTRVRIWPAWISDYDSLRPWPDTQGKDGDSHAEGRCHWDTVNGRAICIVEIDSLKASGSVGKASYKARVDTVLSVPKNDWVQIIFYDEDGNVPSELDSLKYGFFFYLSWEGISDDSVGGCGLDGPEIVGGHTSLGISSNGSYVDSFTTYPDYDPEEPYQDASMRASVGALRYVPPPAGTEFVRGDYDASGDIAMPDALGLLLYKYHQPGGVASPCEDAADYDDSGGIAMPDALGLLLWKYHQPGGVPPPPPFDPSGAPAGCGIDPTEDELGCDSYPPCVTKGAKMVVSSTPASVKGAPNMVKVEDGYLAEDGLVVVPVELINKAELRGFQFTVNYDPTLVTAVKVDGGNDYDFFAPWIDNESGKITVGIVPDLTMEQPLAAGQRVVAEISFKAKADAGLKLSDVALYGSKAQVVDAQWVNGVVKAGAGLPTEFALSQNYPNPFNPTTLIKYDLPVDCQVKLDVYNVVGQRVATLVDGQQKAGYKVVTWNAQDIASGVYFYKLTAGDFTSIRKMVLLK